jgi:hypothetical protein
MAALWPGGMTLPLRGFARAADHAIGRLTGKVRVLADARTPMNLAVLAPLCTALEADDRVEVLSSTEASPVNPWTRVDLAMSADFWHQTPLRRCRRRLAFFHGVAGKYDLDRPERLAGADLRRLDRIGFINQERMDRYLACGAVTPAGRMAGCQRPRLTRPAARHADSALRADVLDGQLAPPGRRAHRSHTPCVRLQRHRQAA